MILILSATFTCCVFDGYKYNINKNVANLSTELLPANIDLVGQPSTNCSFVIFSHGAY